MFAKTIQKLPDKIKTYQDFAVRPLIENNGIITGGLKLIFNKAADDAQKRLQRLTAPSGLGQTLFRFAAVLESDAEFTANEIIEIIEKRSALVAACNDLPRLSVLQDGWKWKLKNPPSPEQQKAYIQAGIDSYDSKLAGYAGKALKVAYQKYGLHSLGPIHQDGGGATDSEPETLERIADIMAGTSAPRKFIPAKGYAR